MKFLEPSRVVLISLVLASVSTFVRADTCSYEIVESMPENLNFTQSIGFQPIPTHEALIRAINQARKTLQVASFYWTLTADKEFSGHPSTLPGQQIMNSIALAVKRGVNLEVILDYSNRNQMSGLADIDRLKSLGSLKFMNMSQLVGGGVLHTKFLIADNKTFYIGSSNFDWRSYTQIKEIGIQFYDCGELAQDLDKIFQLYSYMADVSVVPDQLPVYLNTDINIGHRLKLKLDSQDAEIFLSGAPPKFNGNHEHWTGRTDDIDGLLSVLDSAKHQVDISVMNYGARTEFIWPKKFWPRIDNALRRAAVERRVSVRLLFSDWSHTKEEEVMWYKSLNAIQSGTLKGGRIHVKLFKVPVYDDFEKSVPYARVKHDKYMVTESSLYIGTSNWSPDYFINTCGVGVVITPDKGTNSTKTQQLTIVRNMQRLFERDFSSKFAHEL